MRLFITIMLLITGMLPASILCAQQTDIQSDESIFERIAKPGPKGKSPITITQDYRLTSLVNRHIENNRERKGISGYRIQIYSGSGSNARAEALRIQAAFIKAFPDVESNLVYIEPYFRLRVGNFRTRAEGFKTFKRVSEAYPQCYFVIEKAMDFPKLPE